MYQPNAEGRALIERLVAEDQAMIAALRQKGAQRLADLPPQSILVDHTQHTELGEQLTIVVFDPEQVFARLGCSPRYL